MLNVHRQAYWARFDPHVSSYIEYVLPASVHDLLLHRVYISLEGLESMCIFGST